jgi:uncharacterized protein (DUF1501 family)
MTTRRLFLRSSGLALASFGLAPRLLVRALEAAEAGPGRRLVVVFQRGAMDGLNVVVPFGEKAYRSARPTIAIPEPRRGAKGETAIDLDGFFGLHPALEPLAPLWSEGSLAAVQAVGSPDPTRSHFDAQDFMETGTPGRKSTEDGWLNRALRAAPDPGAATPLRAVAMTPTLPRTLAGAAPAVALASLAQFRLGPAGGGGSAAAGFESLYETAVESALRGAAHDTFEALESLKGLDPRRYRPAAGARYPRGRFGETLQQVAQLFKADVGVQAAFVESGGWDHHAAEGGVSGQLANRLRELASGLYAFHRDMGAAMADVVVVTLTEFGRTVRENGNRGTDHGHASVSLVLGGPVRGGKVHGRWPGLGPGALFEGRDLAVTTDFRDLLGEVLARHLGARDLRAVFPGHANDPARLPGVMRG